MPAYTVGVKGGPRQAVAVSREVVWILRLHVPTSALPYDMLYDAEKIPPSRNTSLLAPHLAF